MYTILPKIIIIGQVGLEAIERTNIGSSTALFYMFSLLLLFGLFLLNQYKNIFNVYSKGFYRQHYLKDRFEEGSLNEPFFITLSVIFISIIYAFTVVHFVPAFEGIGMADHLQILFYSLFGFCLLQLKIQLVKYFGRFGKVNIIAGMYVHYILMIHQLIAFCLLPLLICTKFSFLPFSNFLVYLCYSLLAIYILFRSFKILQLGGEFFSSNKFYFFIYLCSLEILPFLIIIKSLSQL